jgi:DinB superfamily
LKKAVMEKPSSIIRQAAEERTRLIQLVAGLSDAQSNYKPTPQTWSANENLEHLVLAEMSGVSKIWSAAEGVRRGKPVWQGEHTNRGLPIEEVVARTWRPKEVAPPLVAPRFGGPPSYWLENLRSSQQLLERLEPVLEGLDIQCVIFPHFLSGPLDAGQRIHFLRFHMKRHRGQIEDIIALSDFPAN